MASTVASFPTVLWAQRGELIYVTISLNDIKDKVLDLNAEKLDFSGTAGTPAHPYAVTLKFNGKVNAEESKQMSTDREVVMVLKKAEAGYWPRLLESTAKPHWLKTDFQKWKDEDDSGEEGGMDDNFANMMSNASGFNGMGADMGGDEESDSDDDELPDLQEIEKIPKENSMEDKQEVNLE